MKRKPARNNPEPDQLLPDEPVLWARLYPAKFAIEAFQMDDAALGARMKRILKALCTGRRGVDPLADEMLEDVRKLPEGVRMPVDMPYRRPGGPHRFGEVGNVVWDRLPGKAGIATKLPNVMRKEGVGGFGPIESAGMRLCAGVKETRLANVTCGMEILEGCGNEPFRAA